MRIYYFMQPRQTGKSTMAMYEFMKEPESTLYVAHNRSSLNRIMDILSGRNVKINKDNFITPTRFLNGTALEGIKNVILDEYDFFSSQAVYGLIHSRNASLDNIYIYSTPKYMRNSAIYEIVKSVKSTGGNLNECIKNIKNPALQGEVIDVYYDFLTDPEAKLIKTPLRRIDEKNIEHYFNSLSSEEYETAALGNFLK